MTLPIINIGDFENKTETEYPIGKYKNGDYKTCYHCNERFYVGEIFVNSSVDSELRGNKPTLVHIKCEPESTKLRNLIYSPKYSCIL